MNSYKVNALVALMLATLGASCASQARGGLDDARAEATWIRAAEPEIALRVVDRSQDSAASDVTFEVHSPNGHVFRSRRPSTAESGVVAHFPGDFSGAGAIDTSTCTTFDWQATRSGRVVAHGSFELCSSSVRVLD